MPSVAAIATGLRLMEAGISTGPTLQIAPCALIALGSCGAGLRQVLGQSHSAAQILKTLSPSLASIGNAGSPRR